MAAGQEANARHLPRAALIETYGNGGFRFGGMSHRGSLLCLPDDASREAVALIDNPRTRVIDASTAHRVADGWVYGMPEYDAGQRAAIAAAKPCEGGISPGVMRRPWLTF